MAVRNIRTRSLAEESGVPYGTLRRILELNTVADYEQLRKIADALRMPLSSIIADAERLTQDEGVVEDYLSSELAPERTNNRDINAARNLLRQGNDDIDIDSWANQIKAENSMRTNN